MRNLKNFLRETLVSFHVPFHQFIALVACLCVVFIPIRIYEFIAISMSHSLPTQWVLLFFLGMAYDLLFVFSVSALIVLPYLFLSLWYLRAARIFFIIISGALLIVHLGLINYFITSNVPLGADFFGYSWKEIQLTIHSSTGIGVWTFIPFAVVLGLAAACFILSKRIRIPDAVTAPFCGILLLSMFLTLTVRPTPDQFEREANFNLAINKSMFFYEKSWVYFTASVDEHHTSFRAYPMYRTFPYRDVLGSFFKHSSEKPNLVFIIVEGLGRDFVGEGAAYGGFTPFIDSLTQRSLYWENFLSTAGRTFNVLPSEFGSLPYGANGFMEMGGQMPAHHTLISLLKQHGYTTNFFYAGNANFDLQDVFLERQGIDFMLDQNQFGPRYQKSALNEKGFRWGYDDGYLFQRSLEILNTQNKSPRLDIYLTLSTHEPFSPPDKQSYWSRFDEHLSSMPLPEGRKKLYRDYKEVFATLLYFDDALRELFKEYQKRRDFNRTIFFITGDHRLIPIPLGESIDRFHVPFIVYSAMIQEPRKFSSISTHADVTPTVLAFLHTNYGIPLPVKASWLSGGIDTAREFRNIHTMPLMRNKNELIDYIDGLHYLAGEQAYEIKSGMSLEKTQSDSIRTALLHKLKLFKEINRYVCENNRLYPDTLAREKQTLFNPQDDSAFNALKIGSLNADQQFEFARSAAFQNRFNEARIVCRKLLVKNPRNEDVRLLLGRTYAWDKNYNAARSIYLEVLHHMQTNVDALSALVDLELWTGNNERALFLSDSSLTAHPETESLLVRKATALANLGRIKTAKSVLQKALIMDPKNEEAVALKKRIGL